MNKIIVCLFLLVLFQSNYGQEYKIKEISSIEKINKKQSTLSHEKFIEYLSNHEAYFIVDNWLYVLSYEPLSFLSDYNKNITFERRAYLYKRRLNEINDNWVIANSGGSPIYDHKKHIDNINLFNPLNYKNKNSSGTTQIFQYGSDLNLRVIMFVQIDIIYENDPVHSLSSVLLFYPNRIKENNGGYTFDVSKKNSDKIILIKKVDNIKHEYYDSHNNKFIIGESSDGSPRIKYLKLVK